VNTFSILSWAFFLVAVVSAIVLTTISTPLLRRYRKILISIVVSCILLGSATWIAPIAMRRFNPDQSRLMSLDQLVLTQWVEPNTNPETTLPEDEIAWTKSLDYHFKFKLSFEFEISKIVSIFESTVVLLDQGGTLRGFDAYSGFNHWSIDLRATSLVAKLQQDKKLYLVDRYQESLRVSCFDLINPSLLWQRTIPNSKDGDMSFDVFSQTLLLSTGVNGLWALKSRTGEILWKRPEIYTKTMALPSSKHVLVFEPAVGKKSGAWYFLDPQTGRTLKKSANVYPELERLIPVDLEQDKSQNFFGWVNSQNLFLMNQSDLTQRWSFIAPEKMGFASPIDANHYILFSGTNLLEQRDLRDNGLIWQKRLNDISGKWMRVIPKEDLLAFPSADGEGVAFFRLSSGDYLFTAKTSEEIIDLSSYGDWLYLLSEAHVWAFQHHGTDDSTSTATPSPAKR
jgi:hypothetical protein